MDGVEFSFERWDTEPASGFDLGNITITGPAGRATSKGRQPDQSMMVYLALTDLLFGLCRLWNNPKLGAFEFVGTDSSFSLTFTVKAKSRIGISSGNEKLGEADFRSLLESLEQAAEQFLAAPGNVLPADDSAAEDLLAARRCIRDALRR